MIDSHCHLDFSAFDSDRESVWQQCQQSGICALVIPGVYPEQWPVAQTLSESLNGVYFTAGLHPWWLAQVKVDQDFSKQLSKVLDHSNCVAIGECGLDAAITMPLQEQRAVFEQQIALACDRNVPLVIHCRKAHSEVLALLKRFQPAKGGVIHGFSGSQAIAEAYWKLGFYLGVGGTITYQRANKTRQALEAMPLESLLLETDAPDMPLQGKQGGRNSPLYLPEVGQALADLKQLPLADIIQQTTDNSCRLFSIEM